MENASSPAANRALSYGMDVRQRPEFVDNTSLAHSINRQVQPRTPAQRTILLPQDAHANLLGFNRIGRGQDPGQYSADNRVKQGRYCQIKYSLLQFSGLRLSSLTRMVRPFSSMPRQMRQNRFVTGLFPRRCWIFCLKPSSQKAEQQISWMRRLPK